MDTHQIIMLAIAISIFIFFFWFIHRNQKRMRKQWKAGEKSLKAFQDRCTNANNIQEVEQIWNDMEEIDYYVLHREEKHKYMRYQSYLKGKYDILQKLKTDK